MAITKATGSVIKDGEITDAKLAVGAAASTDNVSLLGFKVASADSLAIFNMKDGIIDDYQDATGIDASASTNDARSGSSNYYVGAAGAASGGTEVTSGNDVYHTFLADGNLTVSGTLTGVEYLVVAGGGGGGGQTSTNWGAGGGGAGGYRSATGQTLAAGTHAVVVGDGGAGGAAGGNLGVSGGVSSFNSLESAGGAGGDAFNVTATTGGSGGGGSASNGTAGNTPSTSPAQGFPGGNSYSSSPSCSDECSGGGGGGATEAGGWTSGGRESDVNGGAGSNAHATWATATSTGASGYYAGGGGGGTGDGSPSVSNTGGAGGGGAGGVDSDGAAGSDATANTGGGGGGGSHDSGPGGAGGKGIVIIKRGVQPVANMTLISNAQTAQAAPSNSRLCMLMDPSTGTTTVNTDIKAYVSRDNGTTYSQATLTDEGTYSGTQKILAGTVDVSGQPSGTSLRYKIETLNQSAGVKETRIYGTSLSWL